MSHTHINMAISLYPVRNLIPGSQFSVTANNSYSLALAAQALESQLDSMWPSTCGVVVAAAGNHGIKAKGCASKWWLKTDLSTFPCETSVIAAHKGNLKGKTMGCWGSNHPFLEVHRSAKLLRGCWVIIPGCSCIPSRWTTCLVMLWWKPYETIYQLQGHSYPKCGVSRIFLQKSGWFPRGKQTWQWKFLYFSLSKTIGFNDSTNRIESFKNTSAGWTTKQPSNSRFGATPCNFEHKDLPARPTPSATTPAPGRSVLAKGNLVLPQSTVHDQSLDGNCMKLTLVQIFWTYS